MTNWNTFSMQKGNVEELYSCSHRSSCWVSQLGEDRHGNQRLMIYANLLIFGLSTIYFVLLNLLSASFLVLPVSSKFHTAFFPNCLFSAFTDYDEKEYENASETTGHFQKLPRMRIWIAWTQNASVRGPVSENFCKLTGEHKDDQDMTLNSRTHSFGRKTHS